MKLLILTDFSTHKEFESIYPLARGLACLDLFESVHVMETDGKKALIPSESYSPIKVDDRFSYYTAKKKIGSDTGLDPRQFDTVLLWFNRTPTIRFLTSVDTIFSHAVCIGDKYAESQITHFKSVRPGHRYFVIGKEIIGSTPAKFPAESLHLNLNFKTGWSPPTEEETRFVQDLVKNQLKNGPDFFTLETGVDQSGNIKCRKIWPNRLVNIYAADITSSKFLVREAAERFGRMVSSRFRKVLHPVFDHGIADFHLRSKQFKPQLG